jgi:septal ring factor EnvC (AmiA/AmiB activator)
MNPLQQLEQKLQSHQKRIVDLEAKYVQLLEDLKALRAVLAEKNASRGADKVAESSGYQPAFARWSDLAAPDKPVT